MLGLNIQGPGQMQCIHPVCERKHTRMLHLPRGALPRSSDERDGSWRIFLTIEGCGLTDRQVRTKMHPFHSSRPYFLAMMRMTARLFQNPLLLAITLLCSSPLLKAAETPPESPQVVFPDKKLEAAVRKFVFEKRDNDKPITEADMANLSVVEAKNAGITNLSGLEKAINLASLDIAKNQVSNLKPISGMAKLQFLDLAGNRVEDTSPLAKNFALQYLELSNNKVKEVRSLSGLTNMASLYLSGNKIQDISPLTKFPRIASLYLDRNGLKSIQGIGQLRTLSSLSFAGNNVSDLAPLNGLNRLSFLMIEQNKIKDLGPLVTMGQNDKEQRFAPFLQVYLKGNPLNSKAKGAQLAELEKIGMRIKN